MAINRIICTVTNDLNFDQRMIRICTALSKGGYEVLLIGRKKSHSLPLKDQPFKQKRLTCFFESGKLFYAEYNLRLFFYLLFIRCQVICAIDLDTILPCLLVSKIRHKKRVYDAHELFCEMEEIVSRPAIYRMWKAIEKFSIPQFPHGYTIGECYAAEFNKMYHVRYEVVRNATLLKPLPIHPENDHYILYQGAVNKGRSFETLIPAMKYVNAQLIVCGEGNYYAEAKALCEKEGLEDKIIFKGFIEPEELKQYTQNAYIGITLFTDKGKSNYLSMANRFFDYMHAAAPQLCMAFPEYIKVNHQFEIAHLIDQTDSETIAAGINRLLNNPSYHQQLKQNCILAREEYCWQKQEITLLNFYQRLLA